MSKCNSTVHHNFVFTLTEANQTILKPTLIYQYSANRIWKLVIWSYLLVVMVSNLYLIYGDSQTSKGVPCHQVSLCSFAVCHFFGNGMKQWTSLFLNMIPDDTGPVCITELPQMFAVWARCTKDSGTVFLECWCQADAHRELCTCHRCPDIIWVREVVWLNLGLFVDITWVEANSATALGVQHICGNCVAWLEEWAPPPQSLQQWVTHE